MELTAFEITINRLLDLMLHIRRKIDQIERYPRSVTEKDFAELGTKWGEEVKRFEEKTGLTVNVDMFKGRIKNNSIV